jgi:hypothetical protein
MKVGGDDSENMRMGGVVLGRKRVWSGTGSAGLRMGMCLMRQSACTGGQLK